MSFQHGFIKGYPLIPFLFFGRHVYLIKHDNDDDGISSSPKISCGGVRPGEGGTPSDDLSVPFLIARS